MRISTSFNKTSIKERKWLHSGRKVAGNQSLLDALLTQVTTHALHELTHALDVSNQPDEIRLPTITYKKTSQTK